MLSGHVVTVGCQGMMSMYSIRSWCDHAVMSVYPVVSASYWSNLSGHNVSVWYLGIFLVYDVMVFLPWIMPVYDVRYHASVCCQGFMAVYGVTTMSRHHASVNAWCQSMSGMTLCMLSIVIVCCQSLMSLYTDTAFRALCHFAVRLCHCMLSGHHIILFCQDIAPYHSIMSVCCQGVMSLYDVTVMSRHHICCHVVMSVYAVTTPRLLSVNHASAYYQGMITVCILSIGDVIVVGGWCHYAVAAYTLYCQASCHDAVHVTVCWDGIITVYPVSEWCRRIMSMYDSKGIMSLYTVRTSWHYAVRPSQCIRSGH